MFEPRQIIMLPALLLLPTLLLTLPRQCGESTNNVKRNKQNNLSTKWIHLFKVPCSNIHLQFIELRVVGKPVSH